MLLADDMIELKGEADTIEQAKLITRSYDHEYHEVKIVIKNVHKGGLQEFIVTFFYIKVAHY